MGAHCSSVAHLCTQLLPLYVQMPTAAVSSRTCVHTFYPAVFPDHGTTRCGVRCGFLTGAGGWGLGAWVDAGLYQVTGVGLAEWWTWCSAWPRRRIAAWDGSPTLAPAPVGRGTGARPAPRVRTATSLNSSTFGLEHRLLSILCAQTCGGGWGKGVGRSHLFMGAGLAALQAYLSFASSLLCEGLVLVVCVFLARVCCWLNIFVIRV